MSLLHYARFINVHAAAVVACFFDRDPRSEGLTARPHGRVEVCVVLTKLTLALCVSVSALMPAYLTMAIITLAAFVFMYSYLKYLPNYNQSVNRANVMFASVFCWATLCMLLAHFRGRPEVRLLRVSVHACLLKPVNSYVSLLWRGTIASVKRTCAATSTLAAASS